MFNNMRCALRKAKGFRTVHCYVNLNLSKNINMDEDI